MRRIDVISSVEVGEIHLSSHLDQEFFSVGRLLTTNSISLIHLGIVRFLISEQKDTSSYFFVIDTWLNCTVVKDSLISILGTMLRLA